MRQETTAGNEFFGTEKIVKVLLRIAPPVMLGQLITALYNIVDSYFVGRYSADALTALTVVYPLQIIIVAIATGTGVGVNTYMARQYALGKEKDAENAAGTGMVLELISWALLAGVLAAIMRSYVRTSAHEPGAIEAAVTYGRIVCIGSLASFLEGNWAKCHQARGNMVLPMAAQIAGAVVNVILDPILIYGRGPIPEMGVAGAAYATVCGQTAAAIIVGISGFRMPPALKQIPEYAKQIYHYGYSSITQQALYTVYIMLLNIILGAFSDAAVTVLGLYYKCQSFFFIPLIGLSTCMVPVLSYNYARESYQRCRETMRISLLISAAFMLLGIVFFIFFPETVLNVFSNSPEVIAIGKTAFPIIGTSFISAVFSLMLPVFFQAIGAGKTSTLLVLTRQIFGLVPLFWLFAKIGLNYTWIAFPIAETVTGIIGLILYRKVLRSWHCVS